MKSSPDHLSHEAARASEMLKGKVVERVCRHRKGEVLIEFTDGTRFFVDHLPDGVELSITGTDEE